jgi:hypothetical protein
VNKPTLVAIYARVSTGEQNPEAQLLALREYVARRGFSIYKEYVDRVSGDLERRRTRHQNDSAYRQLMADAARRAFDCVLVWKYDRFARSLAVLVSALQRRPCHPYSTLGLIVGKLVSSSQPISTEHPNRSFTCPARGVITAIVGKTVTPECPFLRKTHW